MTDMVTLSRDLVERALWLLEAYAEHDDIQHLAGIVDVPRALRAALAQAGQGEAVAWMNVLDTGYKCLAGRPIDGWAPLYLAPPPAPAVPVGEAVARLREILRGMDQSELESDDGWWETLSDADFGERKLAEVVSLVESLVAPPPPQQGETR